MERSYTETTGDPGMGHLDPDGLLTVEQVIAYTKTRDRLIDDRAGYDLLVNLGNDYGIRESARLEAAAAGVQRKLDAHDAKVKLGNELIAAQPFV